jgi:amino acid permease
MPGYPFTSWIALISLIVIIISMPFIPGQTSGLITGIIMTVAFAGIYLIMKLTGRTEDKNAAGFRHRNLRTGYSQEFSKELTREEDMRVRHQTGMEKGNAKPCGECEGEKNKNSGLKK